MRASRFGWWKPRPHTSVGAARLLLSLVALALLVISPPAAAKWRDHTPPRFAGLESATTCIPGPIGPGRTSAYHLSWSAARDNATPASKIVYEVYQATAAGGEDFSKPTYTSDPGATSFTTPQLPSDDYF